MSEALDRLEGLFARAKARGADAADGICARGRSLSIAMRKGVPERLERAEAAEIGLRVFCGRRQALVSTSDLSPAALDALAERAVAMARTLPEDPFAGLADPGELMTGDLPDCDLADPADLDEDRLREMALAAEDAALAVPGVTNSEGAEAAFARSGIAIAATNGFAREYETTHASLAAAAVAGSPADGMERDYDSALAVYAADLPDAAALGRTAGSRAVARLHPRKPASATLPVVFEPRAARSLLGHFAGAANGAAVARGTSFLAKAMGTRVFAEGVSIVDDPHRRRGLRSRPCDAEGLAAVRRAAVDGGVLSAWFLDLRSARQLRLAANGCASRGIGSAPSPSPSNLCLMPGRLAPKDLMADIERGLYVTELIGMGVNAVTGDYSRGAAGFLIENGEIAGPVSECTIAGNLMEMFARLTPADDLEYRFGIDSPTVRIDAMAVAGT